MRLPLDKVYRAFPELDRFSDAACEGFVRQAVRRNRLSQAGHAVLAVPLAILVFAAWLVIGRIVVAVVPVRSGYWEDGPGFALFVVYCILGPVSAILSALMLRDSWLRRTIARQLVDTRCPGCGYSMLGLAIVAGRLRCPECGLSRTVAETGMTAADFVAPHH